MNRIDQCFAGLKAKGVPGFISFITAGDPYEGASQKIMNALPAAGVDIIELGMPFTDPMADGPAIQAADLRALAAGIDLSKTLAMVKNFRTTNSTTPIVLMGYYNPIYTYGVEKFAADAAQAGVDGLIVVDLPPEEDEELRRPAQTAGLHIIRLATPTTHTARLKTILKDSGGFLYYVSLTGITGAAAVNDNAVATAVAAIRPHTALPIAVGFGIKDAASAAAIAKTADAVVVGSAIVQKIGDLYTQKADDAKMVAEISNFVRTLSSAVKRGVGA